MEKKGIIQKGGFTTMELMISIAIVAVLSVITIGSFYEFENRTVLSNLSQDVALSVRLAQSYGLNVRRDASAGFDTSYGVHFDSSDNTSYLIFRDTGRTGSGYTGNDEEVFQLNQGYTISNLCARIAGSANSNCFSGGSGTITDMDITFDRPKPDANFRDNNGSTNYESVTINVSAPDGATKSIIVRITGYINVQ